MPLDCIYSLFKGKKLAAALLAGALISAPACVPVVTGQQEVSPLAENVRPATVVREYTIFSMGGIRIKMTGPENYTIASGGSVARQSASLTIMPPENIFAVFLVFGDNIDSNSQPDAKLLHNRKTVIVSARPEFMNEYVEPQFFQALRKDQERLNGSWQSEESLKHFQHLTETYYKNKDFFTHNLGVFHSTRYSLSMARIVREGGTEGHGAVSAYVHDKNAPASPSAAYALEQWSRRYFSKAYHKVQVQNVLMLNGRYFNIYFNAPLASYADITALLNENRQYMNMVAAAIRAGELNLDNGKPAADAGPSAYQDTPSAPTRPADAVSPG